jgi:hypothetical protein
MICRMGLVLDDLDYYVREAIDGMAGIVRELGQDLACQRPALPGANSPYAILTHCLAVLSYWGGHVVAGREVSRDRAAEFAASGPVPDLLQAAEQAKEQFAADLRTADPAAGPRRPAAQSTWSRAGDLPSQGFALLHILADVTQHHGQAQLTRDLLLATSR